MQLTPQQQRFFAGFGYLVLPGLMAGDVGWITEQFERTFRSLRGGRRRRMFNLVCCAHCHTPEQLAELDRTLVSAKGQTYGEVLRRTATPQRLRHLRQVLEREALRAA